MSRGIADTSVFITHETGRSLNVDAIPEEVGVSVITIGELQAGVFTATTLDARSRSLSTLTAAFELEPLPIDGAVAEAWARLRLLLRDASLRMPINDSWIAATALRHDVPVITQDDDFPTLDNLDVIRV